MLKYPILETDFDYYFTDSENVEDIFLLSKEYSKKLWSKYINSNNPSYFKLENENWIVESVAKPLISLFSYFEQSNRDFI